MFRVITGSVILTIVLGDWALAQGGIDPQCSKARDKIGCTCAVQNGGFVDPNTHWWWSKRTRTLRQTKPLSSARCESAADDLAAEPGRPWFDGSGAN